MKLFMEWNKRSKLQFGELDPLGFVWLKGFIVLYLV